MSTDTDLQRQVLEEIAALRLQIARLFELVAPAPEDQEATLIREAFRAKRNSIWSAAELQHHADQNDTRLKAAIEPLSLGVSARLVQLLRRMVDRPTRDGLILRRERFDDAFVYRVEQVR